MIETIAHYLTAAYYAVAAPRVIVREKIEMVRDPRGLIMRDIDKVEKYVDGVEYKPGTSLDKIAYAQGQADTIRLFRTHIGRRID